MVGECVGTVGVRVLQGVVTPERFRLSATHLPGHSLTNREDMLIQQQVYSRVRSQRQAEVSEIRGAATPSMVAQDFADQETGNSYFPRYYNLLATAVVQL